MEGFSFGFTEGFSLGFLEELLEGYSPGSWKVFSFSAETSHCRQKLAFYDTFSKSGG
jgi:hypothetical protein